MPAGGNTAPADGNEPGSGRQRNSWWVLMPWATGQAHDAFAPRLYSSVHVGDLFMRNLGPNREQPGFLLCPTCGRLVDPDNPEPHTYPANIPPHRGFRAGPRAGTPCPNSGYFANNVALGHKFSSEVVLLAIDMPQFLDAPFVEPSGQAV